MYSNLAFSNDCSKLSNSCEYYLCVESQKSCGDFGYLKSFGHRYCMQFQNKVYPRFTDKGRIWLEDVKSCLISEIEKMPQDLSCQSLKNRAINSHYKCYYQANFCKLNKREKLLLIKTARRELKSFKFLKLGYKVLRSCRWF